MTSYSLYNFITINLVDVSRFSDLLLKSKVLSKSFPKCIMFPFPSTGLKVMTSYVFFIVATFQIWTCHVTCVLKLSKTFLLPDTLLSFRKSHKI